MNITVTMTSESNRPGYQAPEPTADTFSAPGFVHWLSRGGYSHEAGNRFVRTTRGITDVATVEDGPHTDKLPELLAVLAGLRERYPDASSETDGSRIVDALRAAWDVMTSSDPIGVVNRWANQLDDARQAEAGALAALEWIAPRVIPAHETEAGYSRRAQVDRMTVRKWLGK